MVAMQINRQMYALSTTGFLVWPLFNSNGPAKSIPTTEKEGSGNELARDPEEDLTLTPGHFLIGRALLAPPVKNANTTTKKSYLRRWQLVQRTPAKAVDILQGLFFITLTISYQMEEGPSKY